MRAFIGVLGLLLFSLGCTNPPPETTQFSLDLPFSLKMGQTATAREDLGFAIQFVRVKSDSRCPMGVKCVTPGKADIELSILKGNERKTVPLSFTSTQGAGNVTVLDGYEIRVVGVTPFKQEQKEIAPEQYVLALTVTH